ncbi:MAG: XRE family transcriptional regulator [Proteobacteria bacterium]|nr:MAG: XRE family transcriptional regulator [Pseudomonadota bacterium]
MTKLDSKNLSHLVAGNIKAERLRLGITQEKLAVLTGLSVRFISRFETEPHNLRLDKLQLFATALAISPGELVTQLECEHMTPTLAEQFKGALQTMQSLYERCFVPQLNSQFDT